MKTLVPTVYQITRKEDMPLVKPEELVSASKLLRYSGGLPLAKLILRWLKIDQINAQYDKVQDLESEEALDEVIRLFHFSYNLQEEELKRIPKTGPVIIIANHPIGGEEGVILTKIMSRVRPDFKIITNFLLTRIKPLSKWYIPVNPFEDAKSVRSSLAGLREAMNYIKEGHALCIFPAGEVSSYRKDLGVIADREWQPTIMKLIRSAGVPVVPVYFEGKNSKTFYTLGMIHPMLRTLRLPAEFLNKENIPLKAKIGAAISVKDQNQFDTQELYTRMLRNKTYNLGIAFHEQPSSSDIILTEEKPIIPPIATEILLDEISKLSDQYFLFRVKDYAVYAAPSSEVPNMMLEIGRSREITYREVGEGTNNEIDTDQFDKYFYQLFIWDETNSKLVGAYRIGMGRDIIDQFGIEGFYINTLFKIDDVLVPIFRETLELGRSFIMKEYQRKAMPLYLLWKALLVMLLKYEYRYLIGPVSISGKFSNVAKALSMEFLKQNYYNEDIAKHITNREKTQIKLSPEIDLDIFHKLTAGDFAKLDKYIQDIDSEFTTPILVRQYVSMLNTQTIGFNIDPLFNYCLDALMIMDIKNAPKNLMDSLSKDLTDAGKLEKLLSDNQS